MSTKPCSIDGCDRTYMARGWCTAHYHKWVRYGDPLGGSELSCPPECECGKHFAGPSQRTNKISLSCENCGESFLIHPSQGKKRKYCDSACLKEQREKRKVARRATGDSRIYDMPKEEYETRLAAQDYRCAICSREIGRSAHRDHCHKTGEWRGLLCGSCNKGLGLFGDDADNLLSAWQYLIMGGVPVAQNT